MRIVDKRLPYHKHYAFVASIVTLEKLVPFPFKGDIHEAIFQTDIVPGIYGFSSIEKRDKFVSRVNSASEIKHASPIDM